MSKEITETLTATPAVPQARPVQQGGKSVLAADLRIVGDIRATGSVEILGMVDGTIESQGVIIGMDGQLKGRITAESVDIRGTSNGKISCKALTLRSTANVKTDVNYSTVVIESGAVIDGKFTRAKS